MYHSRTTPPFDFGWRVQAPERGPCFFGARKTMRTAVYVDGFNLYYGVLKRTPYKWLDLQRLFESALTRNRVTSIRYFTARVLATPRNPAVHVRQDTYLRALHAACPLLTVHYGHYVRREMSMENAAPPPVTVKVWKNEEKGSDVNLAVHLVNDAWENRFDCAVVVSNDSDLASAMDMAKARGKVVGLMPPVGANRPISVALRTRASFIKRLPTAALAACQLPSLIPLTTISKPAGW